MGKSDIDKPRKTEKGSLKRSKSPKECVSDKTKDPKRLRRLLKRRSSPQRVEKFIKNHGMTVGDVCATVVHSCRRQLALHTMCKSGRLSTIGFLLRQQKGEDGGMNALENAMATQDRDGNTPAHLAALEALKVAKKKDPAECPKAAKHVKVFRELTLMLLDNFPQVRNIQNKKMLTPDELLDLAAGKVQLGVNAEKEQEEDAFMDRLMGEMEDEYDFSWGKYENDFFAEKEPETFDAWADRIAREKQEKERPKKEEKPEKESPKEEPPLLQLKLPTQEELFRKLCLKFRKVCEKLVKLSSEEKATIDSSLLQGLESKLGELKDALKHAIGTFSGEEKKKFIKDQLKLWHPDKFDQKIAKLIPEDEEKAKMAEFFKSLSDVLIQIGKE